MKVLALGLVLAFFPAFAQTQDERMEWWREARFGMFIHWGLYSELGGVAGLRLRQGDGGCQR